MSALPEGLPSDPSTLVTGARVAVAAWGVVLLVAARRLPRFTVGSFFLPLTVAVGWGLSASVSYPLALAVAFVAFAFAMLVHAFVPRLATAAACSWLFLAVYASHLFFTGAFGVNRPLAFGLFGAGVLFGALFPRFGLSLLGPALAALFFVASLPVEPAFWWTLLVAAGGFLWQALLLPLLGRPRVTSAGPPPPSLRERRGLWIGGLGWAAAFLLLVVIVVTASAPAPTAADSPNPTRLEALGKAGGLARPGLLFSKEDAFYLFGKPLPVALIGPRGPMLNRLLLPVLGRSPGTQVEALRAVKDEGEIAKMRLAAAITSKAFADIAPLIKPGANEADLEKAILASFEKNGADGIAFRCVVGSGRNATLPHYMDNDAPLRNGLVVIDIGCSVGHYASDMTRTFPVSGTLSEPGRELIATVIAAGDAARAILKPGVRQSELDKAARAVIEKAGFGPYFTHGLGHPVGLDVHDARIRGPLKPGNVITIEPGIYIPRGSKADKKYWDLGVRVEDSYLITQDGYDELTHYPKMPGEGPAAPEAVPPAASPAPAPEAAAPPTR